MRTATFTARRRTTGMSLVELMVAVGISTSLIAGAVYSYAEYRRVYSVSRLPVTVSVREFGNNSVPRQFRSLPE